MYDDDLYSLYNSFTTTETDEETESASSYNPSSYNASSYNPYSDETYRDDYSVTPNYQEQQSYDSLRQQEQTQESQVRTVSQMHVPMIQKEEQAVVLTKTRQRIYLNARLKIMIAMFTAILCSLLFVSIFNFVNVGKINSSIADKQIEISELQSRINDLQAEYNSMSDDGYVKDKATIAGFVDSNSSNTTVLNYGDVYAESVIEELPSNWFNDVCDFFSNLFSA